VNASRLPTTTRHQVTVGGCANCANAALRTIDLGAREVTIMQPPASSRLRWLPLPPEKTGSSWR
jgi:hypothetical protein